MSGMKLRETGATQGVFDFVQAMVNHGMLLGDIEPIVSATIHEITTSLASVPCPILRTTIAHYLMDEYTEIYLEKRNIELSCEPGCSHCCHMFVNLSQDEALTLVNWNRDMLVYDKAVSKKMKAMKNYTKVNFFLNLEYERRACIMLDEDGKCRDYKSRPTACRLYNSTIKAEYCKSYDGRLEIIPAAHFIASGLLACSEVGPMALWLYENLDIALPNERVKEEAVAEVGNRIRQALAVANSAITQQTDMSRKQAEKAREHEIGSDDEDPGEIQSAVQARGVQGDEGAGLVQGEPSNAEPC